MPLRIRFALAALAVALVAGPGLSTQAARADDLGTKDQLLIWVKDAHQKLLDLSDAVPESKYSWRPGKGVRSVGEVYMHVAAANFGVPAFVGVAPPAGFEFEKYESTLTRKADIRKALDDSFQHLESAISNTSDADFQKEAHYFGMTGTGLGAYMLLLSHVHEHLGQSIAYARSVGVVPPWTAKQQAAMKAKAEADAAKK